MDNQNLFDLKNFADARFEKIGVTLQMNANSWEAAKEQYNQCCLLCCTREVGAVKCACCKIREAFLVNAEVVFRNKINRDDREWIQSEKELL